MKYMLFVCAEPDLELAPDDEATISSAVEEWADDLGRRGIRLQGHVFEPITNAKTIRLRDGELMITDGPVTQAREPIAGFNILECKTLEEALQVASNHPMAKFGSLELRPIAG